MSVIATIEELEAIYGRTNDASTLKVADRVTPLYRIMIEKSPFAALARAADDVVIRCGCASSRSA
jgi:predicted pyridoxine 5'-phosphate oxidase superfamily flavin-nucleotide-binding protein